MRGLLAIRWIGATLLLSLFGVQLGQSQNLEPLLFWDFSQNGNQSRDLTGKGNNLPAQAIIRNGHLQNTSTQSLSLQTVKGLNGKKLDELTVELLFRSLPNLDLGALLTWEGAISLRMDDQGITADYYLTGNRKQDFRRFVIPLNGVGLNDPHYLFDGNWHHLAFTFSSKTGDFCLYVDGKTRRSLQVQSSAGNPVAVGKALHPGHARNGANLLEADLDQIALFQGWLQPETALRHSAEALGQKPYSTQQIARLPASSPFEIKDERNPLEFAEGYPDRISQRPSEMLEAYPAPRYHPRQNMKRIVPWFADFKRLAALPDEGMRVIGPEMTRIQRQLTQHFNYYLYLGTSNEHYRPSYANDPLKPAYYFLQAAAEMPDVPRCLVTLWPQTSPQLAGYPSPGPYILNQELPDQYYLKDHSKSDQKTGKGFQFILNPGGKKYYSFAADHAPISKDAEAMGVILQNVLQGMAKGPFPSKAYINLVSENGEIVHSPGIAKMQMDRTIQLDKKRNYPQLTWEEYEAEKARQIRSAYSSAWLQSLSKLNAQAGQASPELQWYNVGGEIGYEYSHSRTINSKTQGYHRASPYFYPQYPGRWRYHYGALNGMDRLISGRSKEIAAGDPLFNPFISPGFDDGSYKAKDRDQIRPGQWLALLKHLAALGADTYTNFMYNNPGSDNQLAQWRIWKTVIPSYAQATSSRFAEYLYEGSLMEGDLERSSRGTAGARYCFNTGNLLDLVMVRKHQDGKRYLIVGSCQPSGSHASNGKLRKNVSIQLEGESLSFEVRKQGSVYIYDKRSSPPRFYQLDAWHDWKDPGRWCEDFGFEAENYDFGPESSTYTFTERPNGRQTGDYRDFISFIRLDAGRQVGYRFTPRKGSQLNPKLWLRVRGQGQVKVNLGTKVLSKGINSRDWSWVSLGNLSILDLNSFQSLFIESSQGSIDLDRVLLANAQGTRPQTPLNAAFSVSGKSQTGETLNFQALEVNQGPCVEFLWEFGDGFKAFESSPKHSFPEAGAYTVRLEVFESCTGKRSSSEQVINVR